MNLRGVDAGARARTETLSQWLDDLNAKAAQRAEGHAVLETFTRQAGITLSSISAGQNLGELADKLGMKVDELITLAQRCPAMGSLGSSEP